MNDPEVCIRHYSMLCQMLIAKLDRPVEMIPTQILNMYRVIAESTMYKLATLSQFLRHAPILDWGDSFNALFPENDQATSPFTGGLTHIYTVMIQVANVIQRRDDMNTDRMSRMEARLD